jgi:uroporphyrinogen decarboxylase
MTSRELVQRTLEFDSPNRIPRILNVQPWAKKRYSRQVAQIQQDFPNDMIGAIDFWEEPPQRMGDPYSLGTYIDEWGCVFENKHEGIIGEVKEPLVKDWNNIDKVRFPSEMLSVDVEQVNSYCKQTDKFIIAGCFPKPFERLQFLRGSEIVLMDIAMQSEDFKHLLHTVHEFYLKEFELWAATSIDGLLIQDDWGAQSSMLISPQVWREVFKPLYADYVEIAHDRGKYIAIHSCGHIMDIIPDFVEMGFDMINSQIFCMGVEELGKRFRGKITFWGEVDRQYILPHGSQQDVTNAVNLINGSLYDNGGVIANCEFGPGVRPENVVTVFRAWDNWLRE